MRSLLVLALLASPLAALAQDVRVGTVREVVGGPGSRAELSAEDGKTYVLRGLTGDLDEELRRLAGTKVKLSGALEPDSRFAVHRYDILDVGGGLVPRLGVIAELTMGEAKRLLFVDDAGVATFLPNGFTAKLKDQVGARVWVVGTMKSDKLQVTRFGILRSAKPKEEGTPR